MKRMNNLKNVIAAKIMGGMLIGMTAVAGVAMMSARSAVLGALMNVRINLGSLKDKEFVSKLQSEADELEHLACAKEKELLDEINQELKV